MPRDPEATKRRLLDAALREFAAKGVAGARVDAIAARARTNKRMIYYYFGSKEGMYREILHRRLSQHTTALREQQVARPSRLAERQEGVTGDSQYVRLLMWEALESDDRRPVEDEAARRELYQEWIRAIEAEQRAGSIPADLDPAQLVLSEIALTLFPVAFPQVTRMVTGAPVTSTEFLDRRRPFLEVLGRRLGDTVVEPT